MRKTKNNWGCFLERLLATVIVTYLLMIYQQQQAFPKTQTFSFSQSNNFFISLLDNSQ